MILFCFCFIKQPQLSPALHDVLGSFAGLAETSPLRIQKQFIHMVQFLTQLCVFFSQIMGNFLQFFQLIFINDNRIFAH